MRYALPSLLFLLVGCSSEPGHPAGGELQMDRKTLIACEPAVLKGKTFEVIPADPEGKDRKDYQASAPKVASALTAFGMVRRLTASDAVPDFEVVIGCVSVNGAPGHPGTTVTRVNRYGEVVRYRSGGRAPRAAGSDELTVQIRVPAAGSYVGAKPAEGFPSGTGATGSPGKVVYQAECKAAVASHDFEAVYGRMTDYLLEDFPGKAGTGDTKTVKLR
jgi:hypothetical protein